jgi:hypothetical protein
VKTKKGYSRRRTFRVTSDLEGISSGQASAARAYKAGPRTLVLADKYRTLSRDPAMGLAKQIRRALQEPAVAPITIYDGEGQVKRVADPLQEKIEQRRKQTLHGSRTAGVCRLCQKQSTKRRLFGWLYCCTCGGRISRITGASPE